MALPVTTNTPLVGFPSCTVAFNPLAHRYVVSTPIGAFEHPSVTSILKALGGKGDALLDWAARQSLGRLQDIVGDASLSPKDLAQACQLAERSWRDARQTAADIGSAVHAALEAFLSGQEPTPAPMPTEWENRAVANAVAAGRAILGKHRIEPIGVEMRLWSPEHGFIGTCDVMAKVDGQLTVIDYKTGKSAEYLEYRLQTSAYAQAYAAATGQPVDLRWVLRVGKDGTLKQSRYTAQQQPADFETFKHIHATWRWLQSEDRWATHDYDPPLTDEQLVTLHSVNN